MKPPETQYGKIALEFAKALAAEDFALAYSFLHQEDVDLEEELGEMLECYDGPITLIEVMDEMESWPGKSEIDIGWAYAALTGDGFSEAIAVVVSNVNNSLKITNIEWGRP